MMTKELERLAEMARRIWTDGAVTSDGFGFALEIGGDTLTFFSPGEASGLVYCRARIASLDPEKCPTKFAESLLQGNFFWSGTRGSTISLSKPDNEIFLTDRFDDGAFAEDDDFVRYVVDFTRTLDDVASRNDALGQEARLLWSKLQTALNDARNANPDADATVLVPLGQRLFSTMAMAYSLVAKAD